MIKVTCALIIEDGKILVTQNGEDSDHPFQWEFPGGKLKDGETEQECIVREIKEELSIDICVEKKLLPVDYDYGIKKIQLIPFICSHVQGKIQLHEHVAEKWIDLDQFKEVDFSGADKELFSREENRSILEEYTWKQVNKS